MHASHAPSLAWSERRSPSGRFHSFCRNLSLELGGIRDVGLWGGGHPFDLQERRVPAGAAICPFHAHLAQWETFLVTSGSGTLRVGAETVAVRAGHVWVHPPGEPHQLRAAADEDVVVVIVSDNPPLDALVYPDSGKWGLRPPGVFFRMTPVDYFEDEDLPGPASPTSTPANPQATCPPPSSAFSTRLCHVDDLPWESWSSPRGRFRGASKELSIALGAQRNTPTGLGGHPFDLEWGRLLPGECGCPYHSHSAQWELFLFVGGTASVRTPLGTFVHRAGDVVLHPPGEPHQFSNTGTDDLIYLLIADNPLADIWHYPDSDKWGFRSPRKIFRATDTDYWEGEE